MRNRMGFVVLILAAMSANSVLAQNNTAQQVAPPADGSLPVPPSKPMPLADGTLPASPSKPMPLADGSPPATPGKPQAPPASPAPTAEQLPMSPAKPMPKADAQPPSAEGDANPLEEEFNPSKLYEEALKAICEIHLELRDLKKRETWRTKWKDFEPDEDSLDPEADVDEAVLAMLNSLGYRFDAYLTPQDKQEDVKVGEEQGVVSHAELDHGMAYLRIKQFRSEHLLDEVRQALMSVRKKRGLIVDLRDNPGGELTSVLTATSYFLETGTVVVQQKRKGDRLVEIQVCLQRMCVVKLYPGEKDEVSYEVLGERPSLFIPPEMPIAVLVNRGSASGSELFARTLQYYRRATIIGVPTCGKDTGLTPVDLPFGRRLYLTNSRVFPAGQKLDGFGVIPDKEVVQPKDHPEDLQLAAAKKLVRQLVRKQEIQEKRRQEVSKERKLAFQKDQSQPSGKAP